MTKRNIDVRKAIQEGRERGIKQWMVAERFGLSEGNFSRMLRKDLPEGTKTRIFTIVKELQTEMSHKYKKAI